MSNSILVFWNGQSVVVPSNQVVQFRGKGSLTAQTLTVLNGATFGTLYSNSIASIDPDKVYTFGITASGLTFFGSDDLQGPYAEGTWIQMFGIGIGVGGTFMLSKYGLRWFKRVGTEQHD
jgi:hypothetical protein